MCVLQLLSQEALISMIPRYGLLLEMNSEGKIIQTFHDPSGQVVPDVSEAEDKDGVLYLGSYSQPFISRLYLRRVE